jgi:hypothetical protein
VVSSAGGINVSGVTAQQTPWRTVPGYTRPPSPVSRP